MFRTPMWRVARTALANVKQTRSASSTAIPAVAQSRSLLPVAVALGVAAGTAVYFQPKAECGWSDFFSSKKPEKPVWSAVRQMVNSIIDDDQTFGPLFVRLAWHASGTYDKATGTGGSNGATMRFPPECKWGANNGLDIARNALEAIKTAHPDISYGDLWTFAGCVAIEKMGGPKVPWYEGRTDKADGSTCVPDGRLPDAAKDAVHIRDIFYRMGFNDREIVALIGAHTLGFCHKDRSGYDGPWTPDPFTFDNTFFTLLLNVPWRVKLGSNPVQFEDPKGELMMLPGDLALIIDPNFRKYVEVYAKDKDAFFKDFAAAFGRMIAFGVPAPKA
jgi:cytochrome c peroxidase